MKKSFICLLVIIIAFSFAACNVVENAAPEAGKTMSTSENDNSMPSNDTFEPDVAPNIGEKGYEEYLYEAHCMNENEAPNEALITSVTELNQFCEQLQVTETFPNEWEGREISNKLNSYSSEYFGDNVLIVIFRAASSGAYWYTVKSIETNENTANVTLQYWRTAGGSCDMKYWTIIIECPKGTLDNLNVVTETKEEQMRAGGEGLYVCLIHDVSIETIFKDFTAKDFPELDFSFTVKDAYDWSIDSVRDALSAGSMDAKKQQFINSYTRTLIITLTESNVDNVLRAVELLSQRESVKWTEPIYEYFFEMD